MLAEFLADRRTWVRALGFSAGKSAHDAQWLEAMWKGDTEAGARLRAAGARFPAGRNPGAAFAAHGHLEEARRWDSGREDPVWGTVAFWEVHLRGEAQIADMFLRPWDILAQSLRPLGPLSNMDFFGGFHFLMSSAIGECNMWFADAALYLVEQRTTDLWDAVYITDSLKMLATDIASSPFRSDAVLGRLLRPVARYYRVARRQRRRGRGGVRIPRRYDAGLLGVLLYANKVDPYPLQVLWEESTVEEWESELKHSGIVHSLFSSDMGSVEQIRFLVATGLDLVDLSRDAPVAPLHHAVSTLQVDKVRYLLEQGCDPNQADCDGKTPLFYLGSASRPEVVDALIEAGARLHVKDHYGESLREALTLALGRDQEFVGRLFSR